MSKTFEKLSINSFPAGSSLGLDGMRPQYLKDIIFLSAGEAGQQALRALTKLCNFLLSGQLPSEICHLLYAGSLCVLHKKDGGIRPIAIGNCLRRLTSKLACFQSRNIVNSYLSPHNLKWQLNFLLRKTEFIRRLVLIMIFCVPGLILSP
jgi:hypothetical protein